MFEVNLGFLGTEKYWKLEDADFHANEAANDLNINVHIYRVMRTGPKVYLGYVSPCEV